MLRNFIPILIFLVHSVSFAQSSEAIPEPAPAVAPTPTPEGETQKTPMPSPPTANDPEISNPSHRDGVEKIEVTGSHIKRIDVEGVSPVKTVNRAELEKSGYNSISDVLRDTTVSSFGSTKEASGSNAAGNAEVDLRGLGSSNTLVLLNGQRLPSDAVTGAVDLNLIPMAAVERIEVLKDGASAIYGSDALGGVVNIITRKDFSGNEVNASVTQPELKGGRREEISIVNGINREKLNMVNVIQYRDNQAINSRDRSWSNNGVSKIGDPGSYKNSGGQWHADPNCPPGQVIHSPAGDFCGYKYTDYSTELPALQQLGILSETNYELNSKVKLVARLGGTQKKVQWSFAPAPGTFTIPGAVADTLGPGGTPLPGAAPGQPLQINFRLGDLGNRDTEIVTNSYNVLLGGNIQLNNSWQMDVTGSHNEVQSSDKGVNGYALTKELTDAIESGRFNPFAAPGQRGSLESTRYTPEEVTRSQLSSLEVRANGEVGQMEAGPIGLAVGTSLTFQKYEDSFDSHSVNDEVFGNAGSSGGGQRNIGSAYTEFSFPITKKLELQLAGRYDKYSDFGSSANPKLGFLYHATSSILVRGSAGTGFKAPLMQDLYAATSSGYPTFIDAVSCKREQAAGGATPSCLPQQYLVTSSGNKNLKEEKSTSYNLGVAYEPNSEFNIGVDAFLTQLSNVVGIDMDDVMIAESEGLNLANSGVLVHRDATGYIDNIEAPAQNLASQEVSGIDLSTSYKIHDVTLSMEHSQLFAFKEEGFPGVGRRDKLGENGRPPWRNVMAIGYQPAKGHEVTLAALTTAEQDKIVKGSGKLPNFTTFDLKYTYKNKSTGTFGFGVKNLFATPPPLDDTNPTAPLNSRIYDQVGRQMIASYKMSF